MLAILGFSLYEREVGFHCNASILEEKPWFLVLMEFVGNLDLFTVFPIFYSCPSILG